jgi:short-subunit dehydrogenase
MSSIPATRSVALVTGASSGIGEVFARQLAARGYDLILVARRREKLERLSAELAGNSGTRAEILAADLASDEGQKAVEEKIGAAEGLELLVNNAGFGTMGEFTKVDVGVQDQMHRLHVLATMRLTHAALKGMVARGRGGVINVSSVAGFMTAPGSVSYCATKHWMNVFTEGLYLELKNSGSPVKVQALCPGFTYSEFHDRIDYDRGSVPGIFWLKAEEVVADSLRGLDRGTLFVIPSWKYKLVVLAAKLLPAGLLRAMSVRRQKKFKRI